MNLLGIEMILLITGIGLLSLVFFQIIRNTLFVIHCIYNEVDWKISFIPQIILTMIGIILITVSQNIW